jgi:hypothetical protein
MNLQGTITGLQDTVVQLYLHLEQHFRENQLIRDLWTAMAHDVAQQKRSMNMITASFWHKLKEEMDGVFGEISDHTKSHAIDNKEDQSLKSCFERALLLEEPTILKVYVPIIRKLRENWTEQALDFYIVVKAHLARVTRATQSFSGDPILIQRANLLLQRFEREVQEPQVPLVPKPRKIHGIQPAREKHAAKPPKKVVLKQAPALAKHAKSHHKRTKPLVEKINLPRRQARR